MTADQLRKSILQQAIQGKLVPQDPNDEPASVLLERIREEKVRLVEEKKIKKEKNPSVIFRGEDNSYYEKFTLSGEVKCIDEEIPFEIPKGWEWCRLGDLGEYKKGPFGSSLTKSMFVPFSQSAIKIYEQKNAIKKDYSLGDYYISKEKFKDMSAFQVLPSDIIVSCAGTIGETYILPKEAPIGIINQALMKVALFEYKISEFWRTFFEYILVKDSTMKGAGSAIKNIPPFEYLKKILTPLPPLKEQQRIVEKIEELIPYIEHYGKAQTELDTLNKNIKEQLKKSILQYAIEGKLAPQDETEGTAEVLLEQIQKEKQKLYEEGKLKKKDLVHSIIFKDEDNKYYEKIGRNVTCIDEEIPFEIPKDWRWCRLGVLTIFLSRGKSPKYSEIKKYPVFAQKCNLKSGKLSLDAAKFLDERTLSKWRDEYKLRNNDILINSTGTGTVGRVGIFSEQILGNYPFIVPDSHISVVRTFSNIDSYYIYYLMCSSIIQQYIEDNLAGSTNQKELYIGVLEKLLLPLPSLSEQQRIVNTIQNIFRCIEKN